MFWLFVLRVRSVRIEAQHFSVSKDQRCTDTILSTVKTRSKVECVAFCQRTSECDATNFDRHTRECQLLEGEGEESDCSVEDDTGSVYIKEKPTPVDASPSCMQL